MTHRPAHASPVLVLDVDVDRPLPRIGGGEGGREPYRTCRLLVRVHSHPVGALEIELPDGGIGPEDLARLITDELGDAVRAHLRSDGWEGPIRVGADDLAAVPPCLAARQASVRRAPSVSVILATRDRPGQLRTCIQSLLATDFGPFEIVVVDNDPSTDATECVVRALAAPAAERQVDLRYCREARRGLAHAHNVGLGVVTGEIVAFTDDDVAVDRHWLGALVHAFDAHPEAACVTGLIVPAELETPAQVLCETYFRFGKGFARKVYDLGPNRPADRLFPYATGRLGSGANMAFRAAVLRRLGGFDPATGAGTRARGGDDLSAFFAVIAAGHGLVYEPAAIIRHHHHRELERIRSVAHGYGVGFTASLTANLLAHPRRAAGALVRLPAGLAYALAPQSDKNRSTPAALPPGVVRAERLGMLLGPLAYVRSRLEVRARGVRRPAAVA